MKLEGSMNNILDEDEFEAEEKSHRDYLNQVVGLIAFTITLACLSFDNPQAVAILSFPIILGLFIAAPRFNSLKRARAIIKYSETPSDKKLLKKEVSKVVGPFFKIKAISQMLTYYYGFGFYILVAMKPEALGHIKLMCWHF